VKPGDLVKLTPAGIARIIPENVRLLIVPCMVLRAVKPGDGTSLKDAYEDPNVLLWELLTCEGTRAYWPVGYTHSHDSGERFFEIVSQ